MAIKPKFSQKGASPFDKQTPTGRFAGKAAAPNTSPHGMANPHASPGHVVEHKKPAAARPHGAHTAGGAFKTRNMAQTSNCPPNVPMTPMSGTAKAPTNLPSS